MEGPEIMLGAKQVPHCVEASERPLEIELIGQESLHQRPTPTMEFVSHSLPFPVELPALHILMRIMSL